MSSITKEILGTLLCDDCKAIRPIVQWTHTCGHRPFAANDITFRLGGMNFSTLCFWEAVVHTYIYNLWHGSSRWYMSILDDLWYMWRCKSHGVFIFRLRRGHEWILWIACGCYVFYLHSNNLKYVPMGVQFSSCMGIHCTRDQYG